MSDYKYDYTVSEQFDAAAFKETCARIERIVGVMKDAYNAEEDGSEMQFYKLNGKRIAVHSSVFLEVVYVTSEIDIDEYMK